MEANRLITWIIEVIILVALILGVTFFFLKVENNRHDEHDDGEIINPNARYNHVFEITNKRGNILPEIGKSVCGTGVDDKILGGENAGLGEYPWIVLLEYMLDNGSTTFKCGGSLINQRYILTAGHCLSLKGLFNVRLGEHDTSKDIDCETVNDVEICAPPPLNIGIEKTIIHQNYSSSLKFNDIGLIRLKVNVSYTTFIKPVCIVNKKSNLFYVSGWGRTIQPTSIKQKLSLQKVFPKVCKSIYASAKKPKEVNLSHICAGGRKLRDACDGDSGSPLMSNHKGVMYIAGIVSYGIGCGKVRIPGVYTNVSYFRNWIQSSLES